MDSLNLDLYIKKYISEYIKNYIINNESEFKGELGPMGPPGISGEPGPTGETGLIGPKGETGDKGDKGDIGLTGPTGLTGPIGPTGLTGPTGPRGPAGQRGPVGQAGFPSTSILNWNSINILNNNNSYIGTNGISSTETCIQILIPKQGVIKNLCVYLKTPPGINSTRSFTLRKNNNNTALNVVLRNNENTAVNLINGINVDQFDLISLYHTCAENPDQTIVIASALFE